MEPINIWIHIYTGICGAMDDFKFHSGQLLKTDTGRWSIGECHKITSGEIFEINIGDHCNLDPYILRTTYMRK